MRKVIFILLIGVIGVFVYQKYLGYTPNYKTITLELPESQKKLSLTYDSNKWEALPFSDKERNKYGVYDYRGIGLNSKSLEIKEGGKWDKPRKFRISFKYEFDSKSYDLCMDGNTGEACIPPIPEELEPYVSREVVVEVDGQKLLVPTFKTERDFEESTMKRHIYQFYGKDRVSNWLTIGTRNPDERNFNEYSEITIDRMEDFKTWKKEIEPELIQIMKSMKIEKVPETTKTTS